MLIVGQGFGMQNGKRVEILSVKQTFRLGQGETRIEALSCFI
jgi:hypothetical protein